MLDFLRKRASGVVAKTLMALLVVSFAIWGIGDVFRGFGSRDLAQVGSIKIDVESFRMQYQDRLQQLSRQAGRGISPDQARALGIDRQLLGEIISEATFDEKARELGLGIDNETLLAHIHDNPAFRGPGGQFDPNRFYDVLRSAGFTEARFVESERRLILRQQLARALGGEAVAPAVQREAIRRFETEQRAVEFVVLDEKQAGGIPAPSPSEIDSYFEQNKAAFRAPEYRKLVLIVLTPEALAAEVKITDEELRKAFEERRDRLADPERREVEQIVFPNPAEAEAAAQKIAGGAKFEDIVAARGLKPVDVSLGLVAKREILDSTVADAVFALPAGQISKPITGRFGTVIARVARIQPGKEPSLADVADNLRKELAVARTRNTILDQHDRIEDERAGGARLSEVATKLGIKSVTIDAVDRSGRAPDGKPVDVPGGTDVINGAFATEVGVEADPVEIGGGRGYVWFEVLQITPSRDRPLAEIRERVEARWREGEIAKRLTERATAVRAKLDAGESFAAAAPGLKTEKRENLQRGREVQGLDRGALAAIFETPEGKTGLADTAGGRIVFRVTAITTPAGDPSASRTVAELSGAVQDDLLVEYVLHLQNQLGVRVNEAAFRSVTGAGGN
jgi:peptidyl-prolyl cis-trans isomerase D